MSRGRKCLVRTPGFNSCSVLLLLFLFNGVSCVTRPSGENAAITVNETDKGDRCHQDAHGSIKLASFRWDEIGVYFTITAFVIIAGFVKIGFHKLRWLSSKVPESCLLVLLGLAVSILIYFTTGKKDQQSTDPCRTNFEFPHFSSETFFFVLLPPIILDSAYSLHDRVFLDNLGTVLVFAVIGTIFNAFAIGGTLYGVSVGGLMPNMNLTLADSFVFSSLISAVDPVAVLAIFQELGVNQDLYFLIFGESLLNDGVTVVLYNTMQTFRRMSVVTAGQVLLAIVSFITVTFGGILIGIFYGIVSALVTKWTSSVRVVEPLTLFGLAYLSYLTAELFHFSGIICLIVCGLIQAHYGFYNISQKSYICVKYFTKMASATSDTIIFMFLGMLLVNEDHEWNTTFVLWSLFFCFVYRFIAVFLLSALANIYRSRTIGFEEQFIAAYGGLRGAVAFSLASTLDKDMSERNTFIFTTLIVILFTIFVQGISIRPLVNLLKVKKGSRCKKNLCEEISETSMDHIMAGIEEVLGHHGDFYLRAVISHYNEKYFKKWLLHEDCDNKLTRLFEKIALSEHFAHLYGPVAMVEDGAKPIISYASHERIRPQSLTPIQREDLLLASASRSRKKSITSFYSHVERFGNLPDIEEPGPGAGRRRSSHVVFPLRKSLSIKGESPAPDEDDDHVLRRALRDNRYNKLHYKYNRNLVNEEDQELSDHLNRRSFNAKRISRMASSTYLRRQTSTDSAFNIPGQIPGSKSVCALQWAKPIKNSDPVQNINSDTHPSIVKFEALTKSLILLQRHKHRRTLLRQRFNSENPGNSLSRDKDGSLVSLLLRAQEDHIREVDSEDWETDDPMPFRDGEDGVQTQVPTESFSNSNNNVGTSSPPTEDRLSPTEGVLSASATTHRRSSADSIEEIPLLVVDPKEKSLDDFPV